MGCRPSKIGISVPQKSDALIDLKCNGVNEREDYDRNSLGLWTRVLDFRSRFHDEKQKERPLVGPGKLFVDSSFSRNVGKLKKNEIIEWKRPQEFLKDPGLCNEETTRFDIKQGGVGNCYFLCMLAVMADNKEIMRQVIPDSAYTIEDPEKYDGVFHARFFQFGKWVDVYCDDYLPVIYGNKLWGAKSPDEHKLWVALIEKAFARMHGSYENIIGDVENTSIGDSADVGLYLSGGVDVRIDVEKEQGADKSRALYDRIKNAINSGSQIACSIPEKYDNKQGLVGNHGYSVVGVYEHKVKKAKLIKLRNPWGRTEWNGAWSESSSEWSTIPTNTVTLPKKEKGEFFFSLPDFMKYVSKTVICSLTPDFDEDGRSGSLNHVLNIYGEWIGETAAGFHNLMQNPRYHFTVTKQGLVNNDFIPLVVQIMQHSRTDLTYVRIDIFKVLQDKIISKDHHVALETFGEQDNVYTKAHRNTFRYKLKPGRYIIVPSTKNKTEERAFLLRLFTSTPLNEVKKLSMDVKIMSCKNENTINVKGNTYSLMIENIMFGEFIKGKNAGGQISNRTSHQLNPQYIITIPNTGCNIPLVVHIMQTQLEPKYPLGFKIFQLDNGVCPPVDYEYLLSYYDHSITDIEGSKYTFLTSWDATARYVLQPGRYLALVHLDKPNTEKTFCIVFKSTMDLDITGLQTG